MGWAVAPALGMAEASLPSSSRPLPSPQGLPSVWGPGLQVTGPHPSRWVRSATREGEPNAGPAASLPPLVLQIVTN